jgi:hypothetical protein
MNRILVLVAQQKTLNAQILSEIDQRNALA